MSNITALNYSLMKPLDREFLECVFKRDVEGAEKCLNKGANINAYDWELDENALHHAIEKNDIRMIEMLLRHGINLEDRGIPYLTPLQKAVYYYNGDIRIIELLLKKGANVKIRDSEGRNIIELASEWGKTDLIPFLIQHGAEFDRKTKTRCKVHEFMNALEQGNISTCRQLVEEGFSFPGPDCTKAACLVKAIQLGQKGIAIWLIEMSESLEFDESDIKNHPLFQAVRMHDLSIAKTLCEKGLTLPEERWEQLLSWLPPEEMNSPVAKFIKSKLNNSRT